MVEKRLVKLAIARKNGTLPAPPGKGGSVWSARKWSGNRKIAAAPPKAEKQRQSASQKLFQQSFSFIVIQLPEETPLTAGSYLIIPRRFLNTVHQAILLLRFSKVSRIQAVPGCHFHNRRLRL